MPIKLAPRKNIVNGSDMEDDVKIIKNRIIVATLINILYIFSSCGIDLQLWYIIKIDYLC
jgi:hypothetical protein